MADDYGAHDAQAADPDTGAAAPDFTANVPDEAQDPGLHWWSESTDGRCSESAALFAASQPAPLSVV